MASCNNYALAGLAKTCDPNVGGIKTVYVAAVDDVASITINTGTSMVSAITMESGKTFKEYYFRKNTGSMTSTLNVTDEGGNYISTELSLRFSRMETVKRIEMRALSLNDMIVLVKDANGLIWLLGDKDEPVTASAGGGETGTNREDSNAYTLTLSVESTEYPYEVPESVLESVTA